LKKNTLHKHHYPEQDNKKVITPADKIKAESEYFNKAYPYDVAEKIYSAYQMSLKKQPQSNKNKQQCHENKNFSHKTAAEILKNYWCDYVKDKAKNNHPLLEQHRQVCAYYQALCKSYLQVKREHQDTKKLEYRLPCNMEALKISIQQINHNKKINAQIRLGKIIHYSSGNLQDNVANIVDDFPTEDRIKNSTYWSSDKQAHIKRNEVFVRIWRKSLSQAQRSLTQWGDPEGSILEPVYNLYYYLLRTAVFLRCLSSCIFNTLRFGSRKTAVLTAY
jgi:hypothetical protein